MTLKLPTVKAFSAAVLLGVVTALLVLGPPSVSQGSFEGTLRLATQAVVRIDPAFVSSDQEVAVANAVYDYLVDVDADNRIQPRLASAWSVSDDGLRYTFQLREGVTFHDGSPFGAEDVVWTFQRLSDPETSSAASLFENVGGIEATGPLEVTFTLTENDPFFLFDLSDNRTAVIKRGTTDATDFNGTGPFRVENFSPEDRIEMVANPDYFVPGQPRLARFEIIFFPDSGAAVDALRSGQVDLTWRMPNVLYLGLEGEPGIDTVLVPTNAFVLIRLRADQFPGNDPNVIQAIKLAVDRQELLDSAALGLGSIGNDSPIGPLYADYHVPAAFERDLDRARELLAASGHEGGLELELSTPDSLGFPDVAVLIKEQLAEIGIDVTVNVRPENIYYSDREWLDANFGLTSWGSRPVPQFYIDVMLVCDGRWNESRFCDDEFEALAVTARTTLDEAERVAAYARMQEILFERGPVLVPYFFAQNSAISDRFDGFRMKAFVGRTDLRTVGLK